MQVDFTPYTQIEPEQKEKYTVHLAFIKKLEQFKNLDVINVDVESDKVYYGYPALSQSSINTYRRSKPQFWRESVFNPDRIEFKGNDATVFGNLCHCLLLEPENLDKEFYIAEKGWGTKGRFTASYNKFVEAHELEIAGRKIATVEELKQARIMTEHLKQYPLWKELAENMQTEVGHIWIDKDTGMIMKGKADGICIDEDGNIIVFDYKTTGRDTSDPSIAYNGWLIQCASYARMCYAKYGKYPDKYVYIMQSTVEGYENDVQFYNIMPIDVETAMIELDYYIHEIRDKLAEILYLGLDPKMVFSSAIDYKQYQTLRASDAWTSQWSRFKEDGTSMIDYKNNQAYLLFNKIK